MDNMMNELESNLSSNSERIATNTKVNSELLANLHTGASNPQAVAIYEAELRKYPKGLLKAT